MNFSSSQGSPSGPLSLLSLPAEVRLLIYKCLLVDTNHSTVAIRTENHNVYRSRTSDNSKQRLRSSYNIMTGHPNRLRNVQTSYTFLEGPKIHPNILSVSKQLHAEASHVLYSAYVFDFAQDVESVIPYFTDLTPRALSSIKSINLVKRSPTDAKYFDQGEWSNACDFISANLELQNLGLSVFGGTTNTTSYIRDTFVKSDFTIITMFENMEWVRHLLSIKGLERLDIKTIWQACPTPCSNALTFFVNFSASIEKGFAEYLREHMVTGAAC